jgi:hypothetical protein
MTCSTRLSNEVADGTRQPQPADRQGPDIRRAEPRALTQHPFFAISKHGLAVNTTRASNSILDILTVSSRD